MIRFRRHDACNFVIERSRVCADVVEFGPQKGKPDPRAGETVWEIEGYYNRLDWLVKDALQRGVGGDSLKDFARTLEQSKKEILDALAEAVSTGGLSMTAYAAKTAVRSSKARKTREANEAAKAGAA